MKLQLLKNKLPKLPKLLQSPIHNIYMLGKIINSKLPKSYLSYLNRKNSFQVSSVSTGKIRVSTQTPINKGFGKIGKIFLLLLTLQISVSCYTAQYTLTDNDRKDLKTYPVAFLIANGKKNIVTARRLEITDSLRQLHERDISHENTEEMYQDRVRD